MTETYSLDKLVALMRVRVKALNDLLKSMRYGSGARYGEVEKDWPDWKISGYHDNLTIRLGNGASFYFGCRPNRDSPNEYWETCKIEFNPAKIADSSQFEDFYNVLVANSKWIDFKRFDVAIDFPVPRENVMLLKDSRKCITIEYSASNKTTYLGCRGQHGQVKLYNKQLESSLGFPLTRLEITMEYSNCSFSEFRRVFPRVLVAESNVKGTDLVLFLSCVEKPEYLRMLNYDKRKKIEALLAEASPEFRPNEVLYKDILAQILWFGNRIPVKKSEFDELEDDEDAPF